MNPAVRSSTVPLSATPVSKPAWRAAAWLRRSVMAIMVLSQTAIAAHLMVWVLPYHGSDFLEIAITAVFAILFLWISLGFWTAVYGFLIRLRGGDRLSLLRRHPESELTGVPLARTAIVLPIYHEPVERTFAGLRAMVLSLQKTGLIEYFDFFVLSDSRNPDVWFDEQMAWYRLCSELDVQGRLFYRRRTSNLNHKSGNIADYFRRWGRAYRYTLVVDADSLMEGETIIRMVRLMQLEPEIGILQSAPSIINGKSLFARTQQFANRVYGPIFTSGLAALQLGDAAYWGHNAILRTEAFMRHCGLRRLRGPGLFGGSILSHDFVEAAFMGRAGYEVWLEPGLTGSFEEVPPTLEDDLQRDKRWAKGNLQHIWLLFFGRRIRFAHRMAFMNGIMSYLAAPLWLSFLVLCAFEVTRLVLWPIDYFPSGYSLFPVWPEWHPDSALHLTVGIATLLFLPKILAVFDVVIGATALGFGGFFRLLISVVLEILVAAFLAPIRMLTHSRFVIEMAFNIKLKWAGQNRTEESSYWVTGVHHAPGFILGSIWIAFAYWLDEMYLYWSLPVAIPLILAAPVSVILGRIRTGERIRALGLLQVPEEIEPPQLLCDLSGTKRNNRKTMFSSRFVEAIIDPFANQIHCQLARPVPSGVKRTTVETLRERCLNLGADRLSPEQINLLAKDRESLRYLHDAVWREAPASIWGRILASRLDLLRKMSG
ncbi:MAG: glucans biosynthesis glucosyltransferase MdoH [Gammaproteobacteria bacterium]